jgi:hypothetical protein
MGGVLSCPSCGWGIAAPTARCPACGAALESAEAVHLAAVQVAPEPPPLEPDPPPAPRSRLREVAEPAGPDNPGVAGWARPWTDIGLGLEYLRRAFWLLLAFFPLHWAIFIVLVFSSLSGVYPERHILDCLGMSLAYAGILPFAAALAWLAGRGICRQAPAWTKAHKWAWRAFVILVAIPVAELIFGFGMGVLMLALGPLGDEWSWLGMLLIALGGGLASELCFLRFLQLLGTDLGDPALRRAVWWCSWHVGVVLLIGCAAFYLVRFVVALTAAGSLPSLTERLGWAAFTVLSLLAVLAFEGLCVSLFWNYRSVLRRAADAVRAHLWRGRE